MWVRSGEDDTIARGWTQAPTPFRPFTHFRDARVQLTSPMTTTPRISVFPKCYFDELVSGRMDYVTWIHDAATLGGEGVEHYDEFFRSPAPEDVDPVLESMRETGQITSLLCFSPNFTHPDPDERARQVERQKVAIDLSVRLGTRYCRTLTGQRYPDLERGEGIRRAVECIKRSLEYAETRDVILC